MLAVRCRNELSTIGRRCAKEECDGLTFASATECTVGTISSVGIIFKTIRILPSVIEWLSCWWALYKLHEASGYYWPSPNRLSISCLYLGRAKNATCILHTSQGFYLTLSQVLSKKTHTQHTQLLLKSLVADFLFQKGASTVQGNTHISPQQPSLLLTPCFVYHLWAGARVASHCSVPQEFAAAQHPETASRPLESWRMRVLLNRDEDYYYGTSAPTSCKNASEITNSIVDHDDDDGRCNGRWGLVAGAPGTTTRSTTTISALGDNSCGGNNISESVNGTDVNTAGEDDNVGIGGVKRPSVVRENTSDDHGRSRTFSGSKSMVCDESDRSSNGIVTVVGDVYIADVASSMAQKWALKYRPKSTSTISMVGHYY